MFRATYLAHGAKQPILFPKSGNSSFSMQLHHSVVKRASIVLVEYPIARMTMPSDMKQAYRWRVFIVWASRTRLSRLAPAYESEVDVTCALT